MTDNKTFVLCKGTSGLGNRIFAACTACLYARICGHRVVIDWRDGSYSENGVNAFSELFNSSFIEPTSSLPNTEDIYPEAWVKHLDLSLGQLKKRVGDSTSQLSIDVSQTDYQSQVLVYVSYTHLIHKIRPLFSGEFAYLADWDTKKILRHILQTEFELKPSVQNRVKDYADEKFGDYTIGVHVRQTDMIIPIEDLIKRVRRLLQKNPEATIFLATDSAKVIQQFNKKFPRVCTTDKWMPESGQRLHQNWEECPDRLRTAIEAVLDVYLLAACNSLVFSSQSSFGYWASLLSSAPSSEIYDVNHERVPVAKWFMGKAKKLLGR